MKKVGVVLKAEINSLARLFYMMQGYRVPEGYDFSKAKHPMEKLVYEQAEVSHEFWKVRK